MDPVSASRLTIHDSRITHLLSLSMELRLAFIGFGKVARAFARSLIQRSDELVQDYDLRWKTTAIATASHGCIISSDDIDLLAAVTCVEDGRPLTDLLDSISVPDSSALIES